MGKMLNKIKTNCKDAMPKTRKGKILGLTFAILIPIAAGVTAGIVLSNFIITDSVDYTKVNADDLKVNTESIMQKYETIKASGGSFEDSLKPYEAVNVSMQLLSSHEYVRAYTDGIAHAPGAGVDQTIRACAIKNKNEYLEESLSKSSMVAVATRTYLHKDSSIYLYKGTADTPTTATWPDEHYEYTSEEYTQEYGKTPSTPSIYVVSKKTVLDGATFLKNDNGYTISLKLNPLSGVVKYVKQMKSISNLADYPVFEYVELTYTLNQDLLITNMQVHEKYSAKISSIIGSVIEARLNIDYEVDNEIAIPSINEQIHYPEGVIK